MTPSETPTARALATKADVVTFGLKLTGTLGSTTGSWTPDEPTLVPHPLLTIDGAPALASVTCLFKFKGNPPNDAVVATVPMTLRPDSSALTVGGVPVLRDGDAVEAKLPEGPAGVVNRSIRIVSLRRLRSA